ncbi:uncharacterized protein L969DRAFT_622221 [Mixia osmundae IAM 14324]|uniref:Protein YIP n=1 Tax=Mixia osmundae (strain CBS 9802 / IAM 14324 / JCM 22182 / KY 12970) TaxID=764103 RepID=G7EA91_MIXOS|nr:uncharacterized protein L969DRAFT_622221 [Mixia osmundae IAM 14324]KEI39443.1 hypothetical protein L969DRAFT_622221 [Mixia osmundae IAM 14324]GAA99751.1 hypothetical protein E5Q_06454 [Mixia osmundae IAM 14324]
MSKDGLLFDAGQHASEDLAFKDFGSNYPSSPAGDGRSLPTGNVGSGLYDPDEAMQRQIGGSGLFSLDFYSKYFDIDTMTVLERSWRTMYPREDYVDHVLNGQPDLYGPFWLPTTLIFVLFLSSSLSSSINAYLAGEAYSYDFTRLTVAVTIVYIYALAIPILLWAVFRYWAGITSRGPVEMLSLYGYGLAPWIFVALLSIPPLPAVRLLFTLIAFAVSGGFILRNIYPVLNSAPSKMARGLIIAVVVLHAGLTIALWIAFLAGGGQPAKTITPTPGTPSDTPADDAR